LSLQFSIRYGSGYFVLIYLNILSKTYFLPNIDAFRQIVYGKNVFLSLCYISLYKSMSSLDWTSYNHRECFGTNLNCHIQRCPMPKMYVFRPVIYQLLAICHFIIKHMPPVPGQFISL